MKKIALLCCDDELPGSLTDTFRCEGQSWDNLMPDADEFLSSARGYDGYVISGSLRSVNDDRETSMVKSVLALIWDVHVNSTAPVLGICFGSQAIAMAFGGRVGPNPGGGFRLGVDHLVWAGAPDRSRLPETMRPSTLVESHSECVLELPPHAEILASSSTVPHEIFLIHHRFLGVQGHPEVDREGLREGFMPLHRALFDAERWQIVEQESRQPVERDAVIALGRRLLSNGYL